MTTTLTMISDNNNKIKTKSFDDMVAISKLNTTPEDDKSGGGGGRDNGAADTSADTKDNDESIQSDGGTGVKVHDVDNMTSSNVDIVVDDDDESIAVIPSPVSVSNMVATMMKKKKNIHARGVAGANVRKVVHEKDGSDEDSFDGPKIKSGNEDDGKDNNHGENLTSIPWLKRLGTSPIDFSTPKGLVESAINKMAVVGEVGSLSVKS